MVRHTLSSLGPKVLSSRMLHEYVSEPVHARRARVPRARGHLGLTAARYAAAREIAAWKKRITRPGRTSGSSTSRRATEDLRLGSRLTVRATVALGKVSPSDVTVEFVYGRAGEDDEIIRPSFAPLAAAGREGTEGAVFHYTGAVDLDRPGPFGYTVRALPRHPLLASRAELGLVALPAAPPGMTNGDLR